MAKVPKIKRQPNGDVVEPLDEVERIAKAGEKTAARRGQRVDRLQGECHAGLRGRWGQGLDGLHEQAAGMAPGVTAATATVDHETGSTHHRCDADRLDRVVDAFGERSAIAPGKASRRLQARHPNAGVTNQTGGGATGRSTPRQRL